MEKDEIEELINLTTLYDNGDNTPETYIGEDGFVHCKKCGQAKQRWLEIPSIGMKQIVTKNVKCGQLSFNLFIFTCRHDVTVYRTIWHIVFLQILQDVLFCPK